jgi:cytochrome P450
MTQVLTRRSSPVAFDDPAFWAADLSEVCRVFAELRRDDPVHWYEEGQLWVLSKYQDQVFARLNPQLFSSNAGVFMYDNVDPVAAAPLLPEWARADLASGRLSRSEARHLVAHAKLSMGDPSVEHFIGLDPPRHGAVRSILTKAMNPRFVRSLGPLSQKVVDDVFAQIPPGDTQDYVEAVSAAVSFNLMSELMDVDGAERPDFIRRTRAFVEAIDVQPERDGDRLAELAALSGEFIAFLGELVESRRAQPADDLVSRVVHAELDGHTISHNMAVMFAMSFITGGSDTTKHMHSHLAAAFARDPAQRDLLLERPELLDNAVEEVLRSHPIAWVSCRTVAEDLELRGRRLRAGDFVMLPIVSANRDEEVWERPDEFDITRTFDHNHQAFGWGEHACPGSVLAKLQGRTALRSLLERFPEYTIAAEPTRFTSLTLNGYIDLPVTFAT